MREGRFRRDLFYRISGAAIKLSPLHQRPGIRELARCLLNEISHETRSLSKSAEALLCRHLWPGNVRELRHALTYAHAMAPQSKELQPDDFPNEMHNPSEGVAEVPGNGTGILNALQREAVKDALRNADGHVGRAARMLGVSRATLYRWLKRV